jgi:hypothetical protein
MTRPTMAELVQAANDLEALAYAHDPLGTRNKTGWPDVAKLLSLLVWSDEEIKAAAKAAAYGPGVKDGYHTLHRGGDAADIDARTRDAHAKALRNLRSGWLVEFGRMVDEWQQDAMDVGRYPTRSEQAV